MIGDKGVGDYSARMKRMIRNKILNNGNVISSWTRNKLLWKRDRGGVQGFIFHFHRWERVETAPERFLFFGNYTTTMVLHTPTTVRYICAAPEPLFGLAVRGRDDAWYVVLMMLEKREMRPTTT
jgi:hypothetical protein